MLKICVYSSLAVGQVNASLQLHISQTGVSKPPLAELQSLKAQKCLCVLYSRATRPAAELH